MKNSLKLSLCALALGLGSIAVAERTDFDWTALGEKLVEDYKENHARNYARFLEAADNDRDVARQAVLNEIIQKLEDSGFNYLANGLRMGESSAETMAAIDSGDED